MEEKQQDFLTQLFTKISLKISKPFQDLVPFLTILKENWYDTQAAIKQITENEYMKMKIPIRLVNSIKDQLSISKINAVNTQQINVDLVSIPQNNVQTQKNIKQNNVQLKQDNKIQQNKIDKLKIQMNQVWMAQLIDQLGVRLEGTHKHNIDQIQTIFQTLYKIFHNIILDPYSLKYRTLKKNNNLINRIIVQNKVCGKFLAYFGFIQGQQTYYMHQVKAHELIFAEQLLLNRAQFYKQKKKHHFQPFHNNMSSFSQYSESYKSQKKQTPKQNTSSTVNDQFSNQKLADMKYIDALEKLTQFRQRLMSQIPKDRKIKIYHKNLDKRNQERGQIIISDELEKSQDKIIQTYWKSLLEQNKKASNFQSKRKTQFQFLIKQKIHKQTFIKLRLPNQLIIQACFAPLQHLSSVFSLVSNIIKGQIYMYQAPPVKRLDKWMDKTLMQLESVPTGSFYVGINGQWYIQKSYASLIQK